MYTLTSLFLLWILSFFRFQYFSFLPMFSVHSFSIKIQDIGYWHLCRCSIPNIEHRKYILNIEWNYESESKNWTNILLKLSERTERVQISPKKKKILRRKEEKKTNGIFYHKQSHQYTGHSSSLSIQVTCFILLLLSWCFSFLYAVCVGQYTSFNAGTLVLSTFFRFFFLQFVKSFKVFSFRVFSSCIPFLLEFFSFAPRLPFDMISGLVP